MTGQDDPDRKPSSEGVALAAERVSALLPPTPLLPLEIDGITIWCKAECDQAYPVKIPLLSIETLQRK